MRCSAARKDAEHDARDHAAEGVDPRDDRLGQTGEHGRHEALDRLADALRRRLVDPEFAEGRLQLVQELLALPDDHDDHHPDEPDRCEHDRHDDDTGTDRRREPASLEPTDEGAEQDGEHHGEEQRQHDRARHGERAEHDRRGEEQSDESPGQAAPVPQDAGGLTRRVSLRGGRSLHHRSSDARRLHHCAGVAMSRPWTVSAQITATDRTIIKMLHQGW
jgi:hypothetical protein